MDISINNKYQKNLVAHQANDVEWSFELFDCGIPVDISTAVISFRVVDMFGVLTVENAFFGLTEAQLAEMRTTKYTYTLTIDNFTYLFGDLNILPL